MGSNPGTSYRGPRSSREGYSSVERCIHRGDIATPPIGLPNDTWTGPYSTSTLTAFAHVAAISTCDPTSRLPNRPRPPSSLHLPRYAPTATPGVPRLCPSSARRPHPPRPCMVPRPAPPPHGGQPRP